MTLETLDQNRRIDINYPTIRKVVVDEGELLPEDAPWDSGWKNP
jgi:hypothetical protein